MKINNNYRISIQNLIIVHRTLKFIGFIRKIGIRVHMINNSI